MGGVRRGNGRGEERDGWCREKSGGPAPCIVACSPTFLHGKELEFMPGSVWLADRCSWY